MKGLTAEQENEIIPENTILLGYRGSVAHGTYVPAHTPDTYDDKDLMGVCIASLETYFGLHHFEQREKMIEAKDGIIWDSVVYELRKYVRLLLRSNPNVLSLLWLPEHLYVKVTPAGQLLIDNRHLFASKLVYKAFVGYARSQLHRMTHIHGKHLGAKRRALIMKYGYDCYDDKTTEFLTSTGWKSFDDVDNQDLLATVNANGELELQAPLSWIDKKYTGMMYVVEPYSSKAFITEGHNMLVSPCHRSRKTNYSVDYDEDKANWQLTPIRKLIDGRRSHFHIMRAPQERIEEYSGVDDDYLCLAGAYLSEGSARFRKNKSGTKVDSICITQKYAGRFFAMMDSLSEKYPFKRYDYNKETVWILHGDLARQIVADFGHKKKKHLPEWCYKLSARQVNVLWNSAMSGDGTRKKANDCYYTSLLAVADGLQAACVLAGIPCVKYGPYEVDATYGKCSMFHVVRSNKSGRIHCLRTRVLCSQDVVKGKGGFPVKERWANNRRVVCFEVPNGTLITRNGGKVAIHGNCKNGAHLIRLLRMAIEFLATGDLIVVRPDAQELIEIKRGEWALERVQKEAARLFDKAEDALIHSLLPAHPDKDAAEKLCVNILRKHFQEKGFS